MKFPPLAFATRNFHCGYYADGDELENILHFRQDTIESYFRQVKQNITSIQRILTRIVAPIVQKALLARSEPLKAIMRGQVDKIKRFFGETINLKRILES
jgi:hypothetical protein